MTKTTHHQSFNPLSGLLTLIFCLIMAETFAQQKGQFSQYMFTGLVINPAYAGAEEALSLTFIHRSQWTGVEAAPTTQTLAAHTLFKRKHTGLGFLITNDKIGVHKHLSALGNYAYHLGVGDEAYLSMGLQAGFHNRRSDYGSLPGAADPKLFNTPSSHTFFDAGMGLYFRSPSLHVGLSVPEFIPERVTMSDTTSIRLSKANFFLFGKYVLQINEEFNLEPSLLFKYLRDVPLSFDFNVNAVYRQALTLGVSYRKSESVDLLFKGQITQQLQFGYAYDHPVSKVSRLSNGSHEIMVNYRFKYTRTKVASPR